MVFRPGRLYHPNGPTWFWPGVGLSGIIRIQLCKQISTDRLTGGIPLVLMIGARDSVSEEEIVASGRPW